MADPGAAPSFRQQRRASLRQQASRITSGVAGVAVIALLAAGAARPLVISPAQLPTTVAAIASLGGNALAGWLHEWARTRLQAAGAIDPVITLEDLAQALAAQLQANAARATATSQLLTASGAIEALIDALAHTTDQQLALLTALATNLEQAHQTNQAAYYAILQSMRAEGSKTRALRQAQQDVLTQLLDLRPPPADVRSQPTPPGHGSGTGIAIGTGAIASAIQQIVQAAPVDVRAPIRSMADYYAEVFGGREVQLAALDAFLQATKPYALLLLAPTGRGKTALLFHWVAQVQQQGGWTVGFAPISRRFETSSAAALDSTLAAGLAAVHQDHRFAQYPSSAEQRRALGAVENQPPRACGHPPAGGGCCPG